ncbi:hypothetical protein Syun_030015 [Stephania yunnanensis]|uniref:Uncharacterized protein n=1 Tax=Stephania yunnanensis TaxID=152371 RepID=A0AAP0E6P2_9MAGN
MAEVAERTAQTSSMSNAYCECGEGWRCEISKTDGPDAGKIVFECGNGCKCEAGDLPPNCEIIQGSSSGTVVCKCGEGYTCVITRTQGAAEPFADCGDACKITS